MSYFLVAFLIVVALRETEREREREQKREREREIQGGLPVTIVLQATALKTKRPPSEIFKNNPFLRCEAMICLRTVSLQTKAIDSYV